MDMKLAVSLATFTTGVLVPAFALACPSGRGYGSCGSGFGGYAAAVGIGLLVGLGSVAIERHLRRRK